VSSDDSPRKDPHTSDSEVDAAVLSLLEKVHLSKYAQALSEQGVRTVADLKYVDDEVMYACSFTVIDKKKFRSIPTSQRSDIGESDQSSTGTFWYYYYVIIIIFRVHSDPTLGSLIKDPQEHSGTPLYKG
jgi:hypothetical protein